jgi:aspartate-semialdehyde dehydrogenase
MNGHLESVVVEFLEDISIEEVKDAFVNFTGEPQRLGLHTAPTEPIILCAEQDRPQPKRDLDDIGMSVKIGRIRKKGLKLNFFLLVHNAIRGAAGNSILNAEYALTKGYLNRRKGVAS